MPKIHIPKLYPKYQKDELYNLSDEFPVAKDSLDYFSINCTSFTSKEYEKEDLQHYKFSEKLSKDEIKRIRKLKCNNDCFNCQYEDCKISVSTEKKT